LPLLGKIRLLSIAALRHAATQQWPYSKLNSLTTSPFRYDINALRALAVIIVIGFHFQIGVFKNGFIGVDIFLVISGYLIGSQALQKLKTGDFLVGHFLQMRLRRIFPALYVIVMASVLLGWQLSLPGEYLKQLRQAMSALAFVSNIAFSNDIGYFSAAAQTKPLLHTWSLSVEWQFYLSLPIILLAVKFLAKKEFKPKAALACLGIFTVASFAWCLWQSSQNSSSSFFSLTTRAWELLVGCLIAYYEVFTEKTSPAQPQNLALRNGWSALGWTMLAACLFVTMSESNWPGPVTMLPVLGTALVVASKAQMNQNIFLENTAVQKLGDWSYSLYLWHWPLWVFLIAWLSTHGEVATPLLKSTLFLVTVLLSYGSFRWVEQPFRTKRNYWTAKRLVFFSLTSFLSLVLVSAAIFAFNGVPQRLPPHIERAELARMVNTPRDECFRNVHSEKAASETYCDFGPAVQQGVPSALLWGDSIANQYLEPLTYAASIANFHGLIATQSGCRAFIDVPTIEFGVPQACRDFNQSVLSFLRSPQGPKMVVLARNWGPPDEISQLVSTLLSMEKTVVLVLPSLSLDFDVPGKWIEMQYRAGEPIDNWSLPATPQLMQKELRLAIAKATSSFKNNPKYIEVDPLPMVCEAGYCYLVRNGQANFRDTLHISNLNAAQYQSVFTPALTRAVQVSE
jgi:peptidoglycan/LPS O-acetylase OafA/YrhL